jgi:hypothetical protein
VLPILELAARLNREIGLGSEDRPPGITITFVSNLQPGALSGARTPPVMLSGMCTASGSF